MQDFPSTRGRLPELALVLSTAVSRLPESGAVQSFAIVVDFEIVLVKPASDELTFDLLHYIKAALFV
jgi:hypothetical protein